eukprot:6381452-Karenia_brevis.AAC.1
MPCASMAFGCSRRSVLCIVTSSLCFSGASAVSGGNERKIQDAKVRCTPRLPALREAHAT